MQASARTIVRNLAYALVACCLVACCGLAGCNNSPATTNTDSTTPTDSTTKYTLYIGINSQTTGEPVMAYDDAKNLVIDLALEYVGGYTITEAQGGWTNDDGVAESETSIVLMLDTDDEESVRTIAEKAAEALDQDAILIETSTVTSEFYDL